MLSCTTSEVDLEKNPLCMTVRLLVTSNAAASRSSHHHASDGRFSWNAGMFVFTPAVFLAELERVQPDLFARLEELEAQVVRPCTQLGRAGARLTPRVRAVPLDDLLAVDPDS